MTSKDFEKLIQDVDRVMNSAPHSDDESNGTIHTSQEWGPAEERGSTGDKRYMLFMGITDHSRGGFLDFFAAYETIGAAEDVALARMSAQNWWHIVDRTTFVIVKGVFTARHKES